LKVTRWELGKVMKNRAFLFSTFVLPLLILGLALGIPTLLAGRSEEEHYKVAVVDESGEVFPALAARLSGSWELSLADRNTAAEKLSSGELDGPRSTIREPSSSTCGNRVTSPQESWGRRFPKW